MDKKYPNLNLLQSIKTTNDFANILGTSPDRLTYQLHIVPSSDKYFEFEIPKKSGGFRTICSPNSYLKERQKRVAKIFQRAYEESLSANGIENKLAHGFNKDKSIITNADNHRQKKNLINIDIENFFSSFHFGRVRDT